MLNDGTIDEVASLLPEACVRTAAGDLLTLDAAKYLGEGRTATTELHKCIVLHAQGFPPQFSPGRPANGFGVQWPPGTTRQQRSVVYKEGGAQKAGVLDGVEAAVAFSCDCPGLRATGASDDARKCLAQVYVCFLPNVTNYVELRFGGQCIHACRPCALHDEGACTACADAGARPLAMPSAGADGLAGACRLAACVDRLGATAAGNVASPAALFGASLLLASDHELLARNYARTGTNARNFQRLLASNDERVLRRQGGATPTPAAAGGAETPLGRLLECVESVARGNVDAQAPTLGRVADISVYPYISVILSSNFRAQMLRLMLQLPYRDSYGQFWDATGHTATNVGGQVHPKRVLLLPRSRSRSRCAVSQMVMHFSFVQDTPAGTLSIFELLTTSKSELAVSEALRKYVHRYEVRFGACTHACMRVRGTACSRAARACRGAAAPAVGADGHRRRAAQRRQRRLQRQAHRRLHAGYGGAAGRAGGGARGRQRRRRGSRDRHDGAHLTLHALPHLQGPRVAHCAAAGQLRRRVQDAAQER